MDKNWGKNWQRGTSAEVKKCFDCRKKMEKDEERYTWWQLNSDRSASGFDRCIPCHEGKLSTIANSYISQVAKLWDDLGNKELDVNDLKKIRELRNNISQLLKGCKNIKDKFDDCSLTFTLINLETIPSDLNQHIKEYASPQTRDKVSSDRKTQRKGDRKCFHENIDQDETGYYCVYCWDDESPEFLKALKRKGISQENNHDSNSSQSNNQETNNNPSRERERERRKPSQSITKKPITASYHGFRK